MPSEGGSAKQLTTDGSLKLGTKFLPDGGSLIGSNSSVGNSNIVTYDLRGSLIRKLTNAGGIDVSPSPSPDGRSYVFCSNRSGGPQIYVASTNGPDDAKRISFTNSNYCTSPVWSPKGDKIAFVCRSSGNQLFLASPQGNQVTQLTFAGNNEDPSWSPDGRYLAFSSDRGRGGARNIVVMPLNTGVPIAFAPGTSEQRQPSWSPKID
jgi:TolB protein